MPVMSTVMPSALAEILDRIVEELERVVGVVGVDAGIGGHDLPVVDRLEKAWRPGRVGDDLAFGVLIDDAVAVGIGEEVRIALAVDRPSGVPTTLAA